ncbi:MAG: FAD-dependent oxidoreductase [Deltaproteobacteria bacterium]|nr:FAD-dependent oxidoreductase [Deltaproteobacteria bacterium]
MDNYDLVIVGGGLGGLTAGLFAPRYGLSTLVLESGASGGHLLNIEKIEDFPGFSEGVAGYELCPTVQQQAANQGAEFRRAEVQAVERRDQSWLVMTDEENFQAKAVIVATGSTLKELGVPGESRLRGKGVSNCASCDGSFFDGEVVGVVGGGDSALQEALTLANYASQVIVFQRAANFSAQHAFQQRVLNHSKMNVRYRTVVEEILGGETVSGVRTRDLTTGEEANVALSGVFVYVGLEPNTGLVKSLVRLAETGHIPTDNWMRTEAPGLFAVGDIRQDSPAQAITSAGEGAAAAIAAHRYIEEGIWRGAPRAD